MKNKFLKYTIICLSLFSIYFFISHNTLVNQNIIFAINLWVTKVFPSLFPMFIINEILIESDFPGLITNSIIKVTKNKIKINIYAIYVFIMSIFSGTPSNAVILKSLVGKKFITSKDASFILSFTFFSNPLFLWNMLNTSFDKSTTLKIILIHYISNIILFIFFKNRLITKNNFFIISNSKINLSKILNKSIKTSLDTLTMILGTISFYIIISTILLNSFNLNILLQTLIKGLLELTQGLNNLSLLNTCVKTKEIIAITIISFGGLSIHSQIQNIISDTNIKYKYFFIGRIFQTLISIILLIIF